MKIFFKNVEKSDLGCKIKVFDGNILAKLMQVLYNFKFNFNFI